MEAVSRLKRADSNLPAFSASITALSVHIWFSYDAWFSLTAFILPWTFLLVSNCSVSKPRPTDQDTLLRRETPKDCLLCQYLNEGTTYMRVPYNSRNQFYRLAPDRHRPRIAGPLWQFATLSHRLVSRGAIMQERRQIPIPFIFGPSFSSSLS